MPRLLVYGCPKCERSEEVFSFDRDTPAKDLAPECCGKRMVWMPTCGLIVTNKSCLVHGRPSDPAGRYLQQVAKKKAYKRKYNPLDRRDERLEKESGEARIKLGGGKVFSDGGKSAK